VGWLRCENGLEPLSVPKSAFYTSKIRKHAYPHFTRGRTCRPSNLGDDDNRNKSPAHKFNKYAKDAQQTGSLCWTSVLECDTRTLRFLHIKYSRIPPLSTPTSGLWWHGSDVQMSLFRFRYDIPVDTILTKCDEISRYQLASCLINAQPLLAHRSPADDNVMGCCQVFVWVGYRSNRWQTRSVTYQIGDKSIRWKSNSVTSHIGSVTEFNSNLKCLHRPIVYDSFAVPGTCRWRIITAIAREITR